MQTYFQVALAVSLWIFVLEFQSATGRDDNVADAFIAAGVIGINDPSLRTETFESCSIDELDLCNLLVRT